jgi:hypothetical protein
MEALRVAACPNNKAVRSFGFRPADAVSRVDGRAGLRDRHSPATTGDPKAPADDRLRVLHAAEDRGSRFGAGAGAVMLAVDELALRVASNDSATALSRHDPMQPIERRSPSSVTDGHAD